VEAKRVDRKNELRINKSCKSYKLPRKADPSASIVDSQSVKTTEKG
jgi:hypothetical protein